MSTGRWRSLFVSCVAEPKLPAAKFALIRIQGFEVSKFQHTSNAVLTNRRRGFVIIAPVTRP